MIHSRSLDNIDRLNQALGSLNAASHPPDLLGSVGGGRGYDELLPQTTTLELAPGLTIRLLNLETLIELKEETAQEKDLAALPVLRRTLAERRNS